jgi:hypothetical protein
MQMEIVQIIVTKGVKEAEERGDEIVKAEPT